MPEAVGRHLGRWWVPKSPQAVGGAPRAVSARLRHRLIRASEGGASGVGNMVGPERVGACAEPHVLNPIVWQLGLFEFNQVLPHSQRLAGSRPPQAPPRAPPSTALGAQHRLRRTPDLLDLRASDAEAVVGLCLTQPSPAAHARASADMCTRMRPPVRVCVCSGRALYGGVALCLTQPQHQRHSLSTSPSRLPPFSLRAS
jgi:hypothetical protein